MFKLFRYIFLPVCFTLLWSCSEDNGVGSSVQPSEDLLFSYSHKMDVETSSVASDSVLSKYDYFLLGRYRDSKFGETSAEFVTQLDGRVGGLRLPDTVVANSKYSTVGIGPSILTNLNNKYGNITLISEPSDYKVDSVSLLLTYTDVFFGDSTALQAISVYELTSGIENKKYVVNEPVETFCDKSKFLGSASFQVQNKRTLSVSLPVEVGERISSAYMGDTKVKSQSEFNDLFKGLYVSHSFNQGTVLQVELAGIQVYYHYDAKLTTTYDGRDTTVLASEVKTDGGKLVNPLVSSFFLSANKTVNRLLLLSQNDLSEILEEVNQEDYTYTYTPAGLYTSIDLHLDDLMDSIVTFCNGDVEKVMLNSARLIIHKKDLDWNTKLASSTYMMLMSKKDLVDFFYNNKQPDGATSFVAQLDTTKKQYVFNITAPTQRKVVRKSNENVFGDDLVLVPIVSRAEDNMYFFRQQLWPTATKLYGSSAPDSLRPRLDVVYTKRQ